MLGLIDVTVCCTDHEHRALRTFPSLGAVVFAAALLLAGVALGGAGARAWAASHDDAHVVPLFMSGSDGVRQGFVRIVNRSEAAGEVLIQPVDDAGYAPEEIVLSIAANATVHLNSADIEDGNPNKGLSHGVGPVSAGDWRLSLSSDLDINVMSYVRTTDGFLTSMHGVAPVSLGSWRVAIFNPGTNPNQVSFLRLVNPVEEDATVEIVGIDDDGASPEGPVEVDLSAGTARTLSAQELESGGDFRGRLGNGKGKWRLDIVADQPILVMSLLRSPTGHLTNLSEVPVRYFRESARDVFDAAVSEPVVQAKCVNCHVEGGASGHTPLVFVSSTETDHGTINFDVFKDYLRADPRSPTAAALVVLGKVRGLPSHGGGVQLAEDSEEFRNMVRFLLLLAGEVDAEEAQGG